MAENSQCSSTPNTYSRKLKSLSLLCSNFVSLYNREGVETVSLDDAAMNLGVERRRIYDIVNVMESIGVLKKKEKNRYLWLGFEGIPAALQKLKDDAIKEQSGLSLGNWAAKVSDDEDTDKDFNQHDDEQEGISSTNESSGKLSCGLERKEKSLGQLTQSFVKLLLKTSADMVSLDEAARLLLGDAQGNSHMRKANAAKVRRLYDIANVLSSLNLIEKTHQSNSKKPAFRWLGIKGRHDCGVTVSSTPTAQLGKRLFGKDLTNVDVKRRVVSSVDNGPTKAQISNGVPINVQISNEDPTKAQISLEYPTKAQITNQGLKECSAAAQRQSKASKPFEFGPFCPPIVLRKEVAQVLNFQRLASSLCPSYRNQALRDLFTHYKEAYTSWFAETSRGSNRERV